ncbi:DUF1501 domain-containing protein [Catelliglobosispora koreensis]|uniref:DUF1501 domain-containing protein n=1 Tax=Catelliglobosispora koreensis TaxID=129052 RepID=UPI00037EF22C|nr:DUF1501 domain-containing protein [Catelliglobosispora koreensis]
MDSITRRKFLVTSGVTGAGALAAGMTAYSVNDILATAGERTETTGPDSKTLVMITLYGGNDSLNMIVPFADSAYHDARPELAYKDTEVLKVSDSVGLNPAMKGMHRLYGEKRMAIVRSVGYPKADRSHFRSMDIWHTANPNQPGNTGWLGRWLDTVGGDPRMAVSFETVLPPLLAGALSAGAVVGQNGVRLPKNLPLKTVSALGQAAAGESILQARAAACFADLANVDTFIRDVRENDEAQAGQAQARATGTGGGSALNNQLSLVAQCIEAKVATRAFSVSLGGFDTHADEKAPHQGLLGILDRSVTAFLDRVSKTEQGKNVVVAIYSEFGRRVRANASDGTDHGAAADVMLLGHSLNGGLYGEAPNLKKLDDGDVKYSTDFRDIYATLSEKVLNADPARVVDGWKGRLNGLFA